MLKFSEYLIEASTFKNGGLTIFDIDDTLFHTTAKIAVKQNGKTVRSLSNQEFNNYELKKGEELDFSEFRSAAKFNAESVPIKRMLDKAKTILSNSKSNPLSKMIILTARADFDNKELFLDTFRKYGFDIDKVRVERAGNIEDVEGVAAKKYVIIRNYLNTRQFSRVRLFDDSITNLKEFLKLQTEFPTVEFKAYFAEPNGFVKTIK